MMIKPCLKGELFKKYQPTIFKTKEDKIPTYVSQEFKVACEREGITGIAFREVKIS